ncbi:MAG: hypothetical protein PHW63_10880 [Alphaproteobacteria bacterium]|nr:hypothetical protein [Alphaproteobacteria bacterium]
MSSSQPSSRFLEAVKKATQMSQEELQEAVSVLDDEFDDYEHEFLFSFDSKELAESAASRDAVGEIFYAYRKELEYRQQAEAPAQPLNCS